MQKLKAVIIDDEKAAIETLEIIISEFCTGVNIVGTASNTEQAINIVSTTNPDVVFLDIEMPEINGFDLLKLLPADSFSTIFVTAYNKYAIDAFRANAVDYLLKPISVSNLKSAINKIVKNNIKSNLFDINKVIQKLQNNSKLQIGSLDGIEYIDVKDIILISADKSYSIIHLKNRTIISSRNLKYYTTKIDENYFYRAHNSYFVNLNHVIKYTYKDGNRIQLTNGQEVPISRTKRQEFLDKMKGLFS